MVWWCIWSVHTGWLLQSLPKAAYLAVIWGVLLCKNCGSGLQLVFPNWEGWLRCCSGIISHTDGFGDRLEAIAFIVSGASSFTSDCLFHCSEDIFLWNTQTISCYLCFKCSRFFFFLLPYVFRALWIIPLILVWKLFAFGEQVWMWDSYSPGFGVKRQDSNLLVVPKLCREE